MAPEDCDQVHVNNRIFFWNDSDAKAAGYTPCPADSSGNYDSKLLLVRLLKRGGR